MAGGYNRRAHATIRMDPFGDCLIGDAPGSDCSGFIDALGLRVSSMLWVFGFHRCFGSSGFIDALVLRVSSVLWFFGRFSACLRVDRVLSVASEEACAAFYNGHSGFEVFSPGFGCG